MHNLLLNLLVLHLLVLHLLVLIPVLVEGYTLESYQLEKTGELRYLSVVLCLVREPLEEALLSATVK